MKSWRRRAFLEVEVERLPGGERGLSLWRWITLLSEAIATRGRRQGESLGGLLEVCDEADPSRAGDGVDSGSRSRDRFAVMRLPPGREWGTSSTRGRCLAEYTRGIRRGVVLAARGEANFIKPSKKPSLGVFLRKHTIFLCTHTKMVSFRR